MDIDSYMGVIAPFAGNFAPRHWMTCNGQLLSIAQYSALFALLGTTYGGNGTVTFALPNLGGRMAMGANAQHPLGMIGGTENVSLISTNLPTHSHGATAEATVVLQESTTAATLSQGAAGDTLALAQGTFGRENVDVRIYGPAPGTVDMEAGAALHVQLALAGENTPISIQQPYLALTQCICVQGVFPSRN
jgi:microcystin-dependent protein